MKKCAVCEQKADIYTTVHKKEPFVDGRLYDCVCFTCYFVPKTLEQKYDTSGLVSEESELCYSCENLCDAKELHASGASDSLRQAKISVEAVCKLCEKALKSKNTRSRPKTSWSLG